MTTTDPSEIAESATAPNGIPPTNNSSGPSPFVSQPFSAATEMILKRLRGEGGPLNPTSVLGLTSQPKTAAYEDVRRTVLEGMKTSHNMEFAASTPPPRRPPKAPRTGSASGKGSAAGTPVGRKGVAKSRKRKRAKDETDESAGESEEMSDLGDEDESDDSASVTAFPSMTQSGRKVVKPTQFVPEVSAAPSRKRSAQNRRPGRSVENALCKRCGRGHSPTNNMIVFCDGCNIGWHQMCHDPVITEEVVKDETTEWFCVDCTAKRDKRKGERAKTSTPNSTTKNREDTPWARKSAIEKRAYLTSFPHSHLVDLLLQATTLHPSIPISPPATSIPSNAIRRVTVHPQPPFPPSATAASGLFPRASANPSAPINFIRKLPLSEDSPASSTPSPAVAVPALPQAFTDADAEGEDDDDMSRESTPASPPYPRPGNGLMARLKSDVDDLEWLVGGGGGEEEGAFSHVVFDGGEPEVEA
ncbi:hypothetical protein VE03_06138 [Pseudogymnoascus sp. 23342-1-I1]|nr:hypothetical protein VE03_06138 [Pseudogymnoascus sp. 23342-1-I1]